MLPATDPVSVSWEKETKGEHPSNCKPNSQLEGCAATYACLDTQTHTHTDKHIEFGRQATTCIANWEWGHFYSIYGAKKLNSAQLKYAQIKAMQAHTHSHTFTH